MNGKYGTYYKFVVIHARVLPLLATSLIGCALEADPPDQAAGGETQQAVTESAWYEWGSTTAKTVDLGSADSETCFLTKVLGRMTTIPTDIGNPDLPAKAGVEIVNGRWQFHEWSNGGELVVAVHCVPVVTNRTLVGTWSSGSVAVTLGAGTANRHCFLTQVEKFNSSGWTTDNDSVRVWQDPATNDWKLGGPTSSGVRGSAVCVDFPGFDGWWLWVAGTGSATHDLAYNPGGVDCFLSGLSGRFDTDDWNDGVSIGYDPGILQFNETVVNGKGGWATCVH